jgi:hypothetical protein
LTLKIVTKFSKKETQESFGKNWDKVAPILAKYQHLAQPSTNNHQPTTDNQLYRPKKSLQFFS